jgi:hypothetical protein
MEEAVCVVRMEASGSEQTSVAGICIHDHEMLGAIKTVELDQLSDHWLLKNHSSVPLNSLKKYI